MKTLIAIIILIICISCKKDLSTEIVDIQFDMSAEYTDINIEYYNGIKVIKNTYYDHMSSYFKINKYDSLYFKITSKKKIKFNLFIDGKFCNTIESDSIYIKRKVFNN